MSMTTKRKSDDINVVAPSKDEKSTYQKPSYYLLRREWEWNAGSKVKTSPLLDYVKQLLALCPIAVIE